MIETCGTPFGYPTRSSGSATELPEGMSTPARSAGQVQHEEPQRLVASVTAEDRARFRADVATLRSAYDKAAPKAVKEAMVRCLHVWPIAMADAQIAAIARSRGAVLMTRNARDFEECGINVVNPWAGE